MAAIPSGSIVWLSFNQYEGPQSTRAARYTATTADVNPPTVLADCSTTIQSNSESESPSITVLNTGYYALSVGHRPINLYSNQSEPLVVKQGYSSPPEYPYDAIQPAPDDNQVIYTIQGSSSSDYYWTTFTWFSDVPVAPSAYIGAGKLDQTTGAGLGLVSVAQVPADTQIIYPLCVSYAGVLYYVTCDGLDQLSGTNTLYSRDVTTQLGPVPVVVATYAPGDPYPTQGGYALEDGSLALVFADGIGAYPRRINATTGAVIDDPGITGDTLVAGEDDTTFWSTDYNTGDIVAHDWSGTELSRITQAGLDSIGLYERRTYYVVRPAFAGFDLTCADPTYVVRAPQWALYRFDAKSRPEQRA